MHTTYYVTQAESEPSEGRGGRYDHKTFADPAEAVEAANNDRMGVQGTPCSVIKVYFAADDKGFMRRYTKTYWQYSQYNWGTHQMEHDIYPNGVDHV